MRSIRRIQPFLLSLACCLLAAPAALAQSCEPGWQPVAGLPGVDYRIYTTTTWDPDGPGPEAPRVVIGGRFEVAGTIVASNIAAWNPATGEWDDLGGGVNGEVLHVAGLDDGTIVAAGDFTQAGGSEALRIARWDGQQWSPLGAGIQHRVTALHPLPGGDVAVAEAGTGISTRVLRWDGSAWVQLGTGMNRGIYALASLPGGDIVAAGQFNRVGSQVINRIARWDGAEWHSMGAGPLGLDPRIFALATLPSGDLIAAGRFSTMDGVEALRVARWDGAEWSAVGDGLNGDVYAAVALPSGDIVLAGEFTDAGDTTGADYIARWDGDEWHALGDAAATSVLALSALPNGNVIAAGRLDGFRYPFRTAYRPDVAIWDGSAWTHLGDGLSSSIIDFAVTAAGELVASGDFFIAGGHVTSRIAIQKDGAWQPLGDGVQGAPAIAVHPSGDILASTIYRGPASSLIYEVLRWDGAEWSPVGGEMDWNINTVLATSSGAVIAGGYFTTAGGVPARRVAIWEGDDWRPLGEGLPGSVLDLLELPGGDIVAHGAVSASGAPAYYLSRWNGAEWTVLHESPRAQVGATAMTTTPAGDLIAAFRPYFWDVNDRLNYIARWDSGQWTKLATGIGGTVEAIAVRPNGDIVIGGAFITKAGPVEVSRLARWDGAQWHDMDGGVDDHIYALQALPDGDIAVGGRFLFAGDRVSPHFARWSCPDEPCYADCDGDGQLTFLDFLCFQNLFTAGDPLADCDESGQLDFFDFLCFQNAFAAGCP